MFESSLTRSHILVFLRFMSFLSKKYLLFASTLALLAIGALFFGGFLKNPFQQPLDPRLATPSPLLHELLKTKSVIFLSPEFLPLTASWPQSQRTLLLSLSETASAARDKSTFWRLNREHHFAAVFLGASPAWRSLYDSLLNSPLWILSDVSPWGYLFRPTSENPTPWQPPTQAELLKQWPHPNDRSRFMILTAGNLAAVNRLSEAEQLLDMAETTHRFPSLMQSTRASLSASRGHWEEAEKLAKEALHSDGSNRAAQEILIRALIENGHADEALNQVRELITHRGENETYLFLLARAASAASSGKEECDALSRLVALARHDREPLGASLTYLGQAYAKQGDRGNALRSFQEAAVAPELSEEQHKMIREMMDHIMEGNRSSSTLPPLHTPPASNP
jgi:predicted negative regulator of RcsB-dependent stress response